LEGPFLNPKRKGAHPDKLIRKATLEEVKHWIDLAEGEIRMMTIAPELQNEEVLTFLHENGVVLSVGHSNATYEEAQGFLAKTVTTATHLFNAMTPLHHREPGLVAAIFEKKPFASIIPDGIHVDYAMIRLAKRELGDRLFIITDRVASSNSGIYHHQFKGDRYETPEGILSGSSLDLLEAVSNCIRFADIPPGEAFAMAGEYPAKAIDVEAERGRIAVGSSADFLVLDKDFKIKEVWFKGEKVFSRQLAASS
jgi:N-acetylglucosamine-6-phosphate deacetylase